MVARLAPKREGHRSASGVTRGLALPLPHHLLWLLWPGMVHHGLEGVPVLIRRFCQPREKDPRRSGCVSSVMMAATYSPGVCSKAEALLLSVGCD